MENMNYVHSPLNYIGGKRKLLPQIIPMFPRKISTFVDLFCGGCNVGMNVDAEKVIFNDNLVYLVDVYKAFRENTTEVVVVYGSLNFPLPIRKGIWLYERFIIPEKIRWIYLCWLPILLITKFDLMQLTNIIFLSEKSAAAIMRI